jgi:hypothetical protein
MYKLMMCAVITLASVFVFSGCDEAKPLAGSVHAALETFEQVIAQDAATQQSLRVERLATNRIAGDLVEVKLALVNVDWQKRDMWVDIQVVFYDADNFEIEKTNFQPLHMPAGQTTYYKTVSLSKAPSRFVVFLRNARISTSR